MYAVVQLITSQGSKKYLIGTEIWHDGVKDIKIAEKHRLNIIEHLPGVNPQNIQVVQYSV